MTVGDAANPATGNRLQKLGYVEEERLSQDVSMPCETAAAERFLREAAGSVRGQLPPLLRELMLEKADARLYKAKKDGRDRAES